MWTVILILPDLGRPAPGFLAVHLTASDAQDEPTPRRGTAVDGRRFSGNLCEPLKVFFLHLEAFAFHASSFFSSSTTSLAFSSLIQVDEK